MEEPQNNYAEWKNLDEKNSCILWNFVYIKSYKYKLNTLRRSRPLHAQGKTWKKMESKDLKRA